MLRADGPASRLCIRLFGPFEATLNGRPLPRLRFHKSRSILALLALRHGAEVERNWLLGLLWPEGPGTQAFRNCLTHLRQALGPEAGRLSSPTFRTLSLDLTGANVDVVTFDAAIARGGHEALEEAVSLYRGPLLEDNGEEWVLQERQLREQAYLAARETLAAHARAQGDPAGAERHLRAALATDALREQTQRALMEVLAESGNYAAAFVAYRELRLRLHREANAEPDPETTALFERLRAGARAKAVPGARCPVPSPEPGTGHRAPGTEAKRPASPAAVASGNGRNGQTTFASQELLPGVPHNLPLRLTSFIGREVEIARLCAMLRDGETRLVTLTGPGGSGKTSLALETARRQQADGAYRTALGASGEAERAPRSRDRMPPRCRFVPLLDLADPTLILDKIVEVLRLPHRLSEEPLEQLVAFLSTQLSLLVLDNFEHLVEGGVEVVRTLLERVAGLTLLVTSRQRLDLPGEREFPVAPLMERPSVQLFVDRAQAVRPDFQVTDENAAAVASLCRKLEGLPLAIELAAARIAVLTPHELLARLEQRFELLVGRQRSADPRHRSLRAALDWSHQLLSPELQRFFTRLSIFRGGWTLAAAERVCEEPRALEFLEELRRCSLVVTEAVGEEMRYRLLETLREYGAEQLSDEERAALAQQHLAYYRDRGSRLGQDLGQLQIEFGGQGGPMLSVKQGVEEVEREQDNLRAALDWWMQSDAPLDWLMQIEVPHWGILFEVGYFWYVRGSVSEGRRRLAEILAQPRAAAPSLPRAWLLFLAGSLAHQQAAYTEAHALYQESLSIYEALGNDAGQMQCYADLASLARDQGDYSTARSVDQTFLAMARDAGYELDIALALDGLGRTASLEGDLESAHSLLEEALRILRRDKPFTWTRAHCSMTINDLTDYRVGMLRRGAIANVAESLAEVAERRGGYAAARVYLEESLPLRREQGQLRQAAYTLRLLGRVAHRQGEWGTAVAYFQESLAFYRQDGDTRGIAACLEGLGAVASAQGEPDRAARWLGAAAALRESRSIPLPPGQRADLEGIVAGVQNRIGKETFAAAWAAGQSAPLEQIIAEALEEAPAVLPSGPR